MEIGLLIALRGVEDGDEMSAQILSKCPEIKTVRYAFSKLGVLQACRDDSDITVVLVGENLQSNSPYSVKELSEIDEVRDGLRVVPIIMSEHQGSDYVTGLLHEAIYGAVLEKDATIDYVCAVLRSGRTKKEARLYYGIQEAEGASVVEYRSPDSISASVGHIMGGGAMDDGAVLARAEYVKERLNSSEMRAVLGQLPDDLIHILHGSGKFQEYLEEDAPKEEVKEIVKTVPVIKKQEIKIPVPVPSLVNMDKPKVVYIEQERLVIGVIGLSPDCGCTFMSLNLAKALSEGGRYFPTFLQFPNTGDNVFRDFGFDGLFHEPYVNHMSYISKNRGMPEKSNEYAGIKFILNDGGELNWSYVKSIKLLSRVGSPCIIDFGSDYKKNYRYVLEECNITIAVVDSRMEPDVEAIRNLKQHFQETGRVLVFANNHAGETYSASIHQKIGDGHAVIDIPDYDEWAVKAGGKGLFAAGIGDGGSPFAQVLSACGIKIPNDKSLKKRILYKKQEAPAVRTVSRTCLNGTMEIGFLGVGRGVGVTHAAIVCACSLSGDYKVAYVEMNEHHSIGALGYGKGMTDAGAEAFTYMGIDFYSGMPYTDFLARYRQKYNFIIYDFGEMREDENAMRFFGMEKRFVILPSASWRKKEVGDFSNMLSKKFDSGYGAVFLFPIIDSSKILGELAGWCGGFEIAGLGVEEDAFCPSDKIVGLFRNYIVPDVGAQKKKDRKGGWFRWGKR